MQQRRTLGVDLSNAHSTCKRGTPRLPLIRRFTVHSFPRLHIGLGLHPFLMGLFASLGLISPSLAQSMLTHSSDESQTVVGYDQVREVIRKRCATCHNPDEMRGDLDISTLPAILAGASSGPVVVAGKPNQSLLYKSAAHLDDPVMPPNSPKIPGRELDLIRRWVEGGLAEKTGPRSALPTNTKEEIIVATEASISPKSKLETASGCAPVRPLLRSTAITALDANPKQNIVAVSGNQQAVLLDIATGKWVGAFDFSEGDVTALRFSRDGQLLIVAGGVAGLSGRVVAFEVATGKRVFELADEKDSILSVDLSPDGSLVALGGPAKVVRIYKVSSGEVLHTLRKHTDWVLTLRFSTDGLLLASGDRFGGLFVWDPSRGTEFHTLRGHVGPINSIAWDDSSETLVSGGEDGRIRTWNLHRGELTSQWNAGVGAILSLDTNGSLVACGGRSKDIAIWNGPEQAIGSHVGIDQIERVAITDGGKSLVSTDAVGNVSLLELKSVKEQWSLSLPIDETEHQVLSTRVKEAELEFVNRLKEKSLEPSMLPTDSEPNEILDANSKKDATVATPSAAFALKAELEASRHDITELHKSMAVIAESLSLTAQTIQKLQQSQVTLQAQFEKHEQLLSASEKRAAAVESAYANLLSSNRQLAADVQRQQQQSLKAKLERQQKLLAHSLQLLEDVNASSESKQDAPSLQRTQQIALELTQELKKRSDEISWRLNTVEELPSNRSSLVDAEK